MKKFLNTMLVTAAVVSAASVASAATGSNVAKGAYLGATAGAANTNVKYNMVSINSIATSGGAVSAAQNTANVSANSGKIAGLFGVVAGYNFQSGSLVFGGEIYGGFDSTKVTVINGAAADGNGAGSAVGNLVVSRKNFLGFAPRIGFMVAPNTLMYVRLGMEAGKWKASVTPNQNGLNIPQNTAATTLKDGSRPVQSSSKGGMSFAPGLGMEVYMGKAFLRAQYSYLFGPKIDVKQDMRGYATGQFNGDYAAHSMKVTQHKVELAVGYKF